MITLTPSLAVGGEAGRLPEAVDLGLPSGLKWATCNVGATSPEEYGDYFAWGETDPKSSYVWTNYKYGNGTGVAGRIVTGKKAGYTDKSIFLPAAGYRNGTTDLYDVGSKGYFWSSSLSTDGPNFVYGANIYSGDILRTYNYYRYRGYSVRPVIE